ncbi:MAG TPA: TetR/AcrR family transcriptional regulator [Dehalococcoidia bacterium]
MARQTAVQGQACVPAVGTRRAQIQASALRHFSRRGYHGANLRAIAADAGMEAGSLYYHYESKEALLFDIISTALDERLRALRRAIVGDASPPERLRQAVRFHVTYHAEQRDVARVVHREWEHLTGRFREAIQERRDAYQRAFEEILQAGIEEGRFPPQDVKLVVFAILAIGHGVTRWYRPGGRLSAAAVADCYAELTLQAVLASAAQVHAAA